MASSGNEVAPPPTPALPTLRTPPSLAELSRNSTRLSFIPQVRSIAIQTPHLGIRIVSVHVNFLNRRITVSEDTSGSGEPDGSIEDMRILASKNAVEAMPTVEMVDKGCECAICLKDITSGGELAKKMPCEHKYHSSCIEKWLRIHGSCPVCRYEMPIDEGGENKENEFNDIDEDEDGEDEDDEDDDEYWEDEEQGVDGFENGVSFHYVVDGASGQVFDVDIDIITDGGDDDMGGI
ncbi:hypothetical protein Leryth_011283 [Lithospermum erythrorhizon]|nr:hypothetical protein Leryth_011283 [Lithospermum erythrorhizon]